MKLFQHELNHAMMLYLTRVRLVMAIAILTTCLLPHILVELHGIISLNNKAINKTMEQVLLHRRQNGIDVLLNF